MIKKLFTSTLLLLLSGNSWAWVPSGEVIKIKPRGVEYCNSISYKVNAQDSFYAVFLPTPNRIQFYREDPSTSGAGPSFLTLNLINFYGEGPRKKNKVTFYAAYVPEPVLLPPPDTLGNAITMIGEITLNKQEELVKNVKVSFHDSGLFFNDPGCYTKATGKGKFVRRLLPPT